tara:strand:+ start:4070 stop:5125 length:1056 start_codon:yes stop_codon:yes gene_type:complete
MGRHAVPEEELMEVLTADKNFNNRYQAAESLGLKYATYMQRLHKAEDRLGDISKAPDFEIPDLPSEEMDIEDLVQTVTDRYERRAKAKDAMDWIDIKVNIDGPIGILWMGDPHIDDNYCNWTRLREDIKLIQSNPAIKGASIGDVHNNWIGRLSLKCSPEQETTTAQTYSLISWLINSMDPLILIRGNHDCWTPFHKDAMTWMKQPRSITNDWQVKFRLNFSNGYSLSVDSRHDFPGHSQYNPLHAQMKASLWNSDADLYIAGHRHNWAIQKIEQRNGKVASLVRLKGYKDYDQYAVEKGFSQQKHGQSILQVIDPYSSSESKQNFFENPQEGHDFLLYLQDKYSKGQHKK